MEKFIKDWELVRANRKQIELLEKSSKKIDKVAVLLLSGMPLTGRRIISECNLYCYRDAIYDLGKRGFDIRSKTIRSDKGVEHRVWYLAGFSIDFLKMRDYRAFMA